MSDSHEAHEAHTGPIKTPKQLIWAVVASFVVPIIAIILLVNYVAMGDKTGAGSKAMEPEAVAKRIAPVGRVDLKDASDVAAMKTGEQVYQTACAACHNSGAAGAPKLGDAGAWAARIKTGYDTLLNSALKGKGAMGAQGGGDYSDLEIGRAVVYMANQAGAKFAEPAAPAAAAGASAPKCGDSAPPSFLWRRGALAQTHRRTRCLSTLPLHAAFGWRCRF
jgi:cytochrome c5